MLVPYAAFLLLATIWLSASRRSASALLLPLALATLQVAYGVGFLAALAQAVLKRERAEPAPLKSDVSDEERSAA